jgi:hypothetical protein
VQEEQKPLGSQINSMLWVDRCDEADWAWRDSGQLYEFPGCNVGMIR